MEFRLKPFGFMLLLAVTCAALIFDCAEWSQMRIVKSQAEAQATGSGHLVLLASSAGNGWLQRQVERFNKQNKGKIEITIRFKDSSAALSAILAKRETPTMWSPGGAEWAARLGDQWAKSHQGQAIVDVADAASFRTYLQTPLVFVSKRNAAPATTPASTGNAHGTPESIAGNYLPAGAGAQQASRRVAFSDPSSSDTGRMAVGMMLSSYALHNSGSTDDLDTVAKSAGFLQYLRGLHDSPVSDSFTKTGGSAVLDAFVHNPKLYDVVAAFESDALAAAANDSSLVVTYPSPTCVEDQSVAVLSGAHWVSPEQRAAAQNFLRFLASSESLSEGVRSHFRPAHPTAHLTLAAELKTMGKQGFRQVFDSIDAASGAATDDAAHAWRVAAAGTEARPTAKIVAYAH